MMTLEWRARRCYSEKLFDMSDSEFVEMMLVDACVIIEVLRHFGRGEEFMDGSSFFLIEPWQISILVRDLLLLLENQIPFFVLERLFDLSESEEGISTVPLIKMALNFFNLAFPLSLDCIDKFNHLEPKHLLDLILQTVRPSNPPKKSLFSSTHSRIASDLLLKNPASRSNQKDDDQHSLQSKPSTSKRTVEHKMVCLLPKAWELRKLGIKFKPRCANSFTDINFKDGILEIPPITINDLFITMLVNCIFLEYRFECSSDLTAYAFLLSCLIRDPTDVECLCSDGIISTFSNNSEQVVLALNDIGLGIYDIMFDKIQDFYLYKTLMEAERYYTGNAITRQLYTLRDPRILLFCVTTLYSTCYIFNLGSKVLMRLVYQATLYDPRYLPSFIMILFSLLLFYLW